MSPGTPDVNCTDGAGGRLIAGTFAPSQGRIYYILEFTYYLGGNFFPQLTENQGQSFETCEITFTIL